MSANEWRYFALGNGRRYRWDGSAWLSGWPKRVQAFDETTGEWFDTPNSNPRAVIQRGGLADKLTAALQEKGNG